MSDNILKSEIKKNYLSTDTIVSLAKFAKTLNLNAGISFLQNSILKILKNIKFLTLQNTICRIFKLQIFDLLLKTKKKIYVSTGCQTEKNIKATIKNTQNTKL